MSNQPWWTVPEYFDNPLIFFIEAEQEDFIFGPEDRYLRNIEVHSQTLIQLESWFTHSGNTRVTVVGPERAKEWLLDMMRSVWSVDMDTHVRGVRMLQRVRRQPLTPADVRGRMPPYIWDPFLDVSVNRHSTPEEDPLIVWALRAIQHL